MLEHFHFATKIFHISTVGMEFGAYCMNHLLLPMIQRWLRRQSISNATNGGHPSGDEQWRENKFEVRNFKQCVGLTVETVVKYLNKNPG